MGIAGEGSSHVPSILEMVQATGETFCFLWHLPWMCSFQFLMDFLGISDRVQGYSFRPGLDKCQLPWCPSWGWLPGFLPRGSQGVCNCVSATVCQIFTFTCSSEHPGLGSAVVGCAPERGRAFPLLTSAMANPDAVCHKWSLYTCECTVHLSLFRHSVYCSTPFFCILPHSAVLPYTALYCTAVPYSVLHCIAVPYSVLHCPLLLYRTALHYSTLPHCIARHYILPFITLYCLQLFCLFYCMLCCVPHYTTLHCFLLHCSVYSTQ